MMAVGSVEILAGDAGRRGRRTDHVPHRWTAARKTEFLDRLAATCNVSASALAIGVSSHAAHRLRRRDAAFAAEWNVALEAGYQLLETHLVGAALAMSGALGDAECRVAGDADAVAQFDAGFRMLRHCASTRRGLQANATKWGMSTPAETDAQILRKLAALAARRLLA